MGGSRFRLIQHVEWSVQTGPLITQADREGGLWAVWLSLLPAGQSSQWERFSPVPLSTAYLAFQKFKRQQGCVCFSVVTGWLVWGVFVAVDDWHSFQLTWLWSVLTGLTVSLPTGWSSLSCWPAKNHYQQTFSILFCLVIFVIYYYIFIIIFKMNVHVNDFPDTGKWFAV